MIKIVGELRNSISSCVPCTDEVALKMYQRTYLKDNFINIDTDSVEQIKHSTKNIKSLVKRKYV